LNIQNTGLENIRVLCIETEFSKRYGLKNNSCSIGKLGEIKEICSGGHGVRFLLVLDVFSDRIRYMVNIVKHRGSRKIVFVLKPGISRKYFKRYMRNPLDNITGLEYSIGFYIDSTLSNPEEPERSFVKLRFDDYLKIITTRIPKLMGLFVVKTLRILKFLIVGTTGYVINVTSAYILMHFLIHIFGRARASILVALLAIEISINWNYMLHEKWTFRDVPRLKSMEAYVKRWFEYHIVSIGSIITQTLSVYMLTGIMSKPLIISITIGVILGFSLNYLLSRKLVWGVSFEYR